MQCGFAFDSGNALFAPKIFGARIWNVNWHLAAVASHSPNSHKTNRTKPYLKFCLMASRIVDDVLTHQTVNLTLAVTSNVWPVVALHLSSFWTVKRASKEEWTTQHSPQVSSTTTTKTNCEAEKHTSTKNNRQHIAHWQHKNPPKIRVKIIKINARRLRPVERMQEKRADATQQAK